MEFSALAPEVTNRPRPASRKWVDIVNELKQHRQDCTEAGCEHWGYVGEYAPAVAWQIREGKFPAFLDGKNAGMPDAVFMRAHWKVTARRSEREGRSHIWVTWLGD